MHGAVRTMLAAAAGAALVAGGVTVVRLSEADAAVAAPAPVGTTARTGIIPELPVDDRRPEPVEAPVAAPQPSPRTAPAAV
ncbi:hypothetical protein I4I84_15665, partial [Pseudonocardia sp. KRD-182]